jgi:hypothetical protein
MFAYFQNKLKDHEEQLRVNQEMSVALFKRINSVIELNYLDSDLYKYLVNPTDWIDTLKKEIALDLHELGNYKVEKVLVKQKTTMTEDDLSEWTIILNMDDKTSFTDFTKLIYQKIKDVLILTNNDTSQVESFKEGRGYYDINSFEEATYNNMYYDYMKTMGDGSTGGPKVKIKVLEEENNKVRIEINKF